MNGQTLLPKKRGPKPTGVGTLVGVRLQANQMAALDAWIMQQPSRPSRPEAIRHALAAFLSQADRVDR